MERMFKREKGYIVSERGGGRTGGVGAAIEL